MSDRATRVYLPGAFCHQNKGDQLLVVALVKALRTRLGPATEMRVASLFPELDQGRYGEVAVGPTPLRRFRDAQDPRAPRRAWAAAWCFVIAAGVWAKLPWLSWFLPRGWAWALGQAKRSDIAVGVPGGYLMAADASAHWWLGHLCALWACIVAGTPVVLSPCSVGPFHPRYRALARFLLRRVDLIVLRERRSLEHLRALGVDERRVVLAADMAFAYEDLDSDRRTSGRPVVGISVRRWSFPGHREPDHLWAAYLDALAGLADWISTELEAKVVFVPQAVGSGGDDPDVAREVVSRCRQAGSIDILDEDLDLQTLGSVYGELELLVGTRMHANLMAVLEGTPVVAIAYEAKTAGIMQQLGLGRYVLDIAEVRADLLIELVSEAWSRRGETTALIAQARPRLRDMALAWMERLEALRSAGE